jgi:PhnB protein
MSEITASTYINFHGRAREALEFYQKALGGKLQFLTFDPNGPPKPAGPNDSIMHSMLEVGGVTIMATDGMPQNAPTVGDNMSIALTGSDRQKLTLAFDLLSESGSVEMPLKGEAWGDTFGSFVDKFGINWMVDITKNEA